MALFVLDEVIDKRRVAHFLDRLCVLTKIRLLEGLFEGVGELLLGDIQLDELRPLGHSDQHVCTSLLGLLD